MNFWEKITGSDMTREFKIFEKRVKKLPADYQAAWVEINANLWAYTNFTGRNLMPILDRVLGLFEETAADGQLSLYVAKRALCAFLIIITLKKLFI
ncbi:DUF1048 domain-containing protein [Caldifermentibacillus hisashii]|uniref:DUF1048 domain-containing protein n=1 Tax=Bacillaceae TaxID=186817 RepID=UPI0022DF6DEC|nr:DUF1048 domain-containing protein [Caldibacillus thermoamylovorans]